MNTINIPTLPQSLHWLNQPQIWDLSLDSQLTITAAPKTDWFIDPQGAVTISNAPALLFPTTGPCVFSARVTVNHIDTYDAGVLMIYEKPSMWAKLCLELSPQRIPTIVSVVTKGLSDDCNAFPVNGPMYLRVSRLEQAYAFHVSQNGIDWSLIRYFKLEDNKNAQMGFLTQSPKGNGCTAFYRNIRFEERRLEDIRSGE